MKIRLVCTPTGLVPETDADYDLKKSLKIGNTYEAVIREVRNPKFHRLYFCLINTAWEYLSEEQQHFFYDSKESFRKTVEIAAGHCEPVYNRTRNEWIEMPKSVAFDKLTEYEFSQLYERIKDVLYQSFIPDVNKEEFEYNLRYF